MTNEEIRNKELADWNTQHGLLYSVESVDKIQNITRKEERNALIKEIDEIIYNYEERPEGMNTFGCLADIEVKLNSLREAK